ncbi:MAG: DNA-binding protein [Anaerolineae bacterium CG03_land_8_20_14_0_80_58_20]|nr:MAG: DNA-binding protein [Anaerolineae bacterium CG03_land_8_20_14_0_80_58_20]
MKDNRDLALDWLAKAESDLSAADRVLQGEGPYDTAFFHAQQAIEKALKTLLALHSQPIPRTHDLDELQRQVLAVHPLPNLASMDLAETTDYAVQIRYDIEFWPEKEIPEEAYSLAKRIMNIIRDTLAI